MATVEIEYCVPCGFRERALAVAEEILQATETSIDEMTLQMGDHGVFEVSVDGETVFDKEEQAFEPAEIVAAVEAAL